MFSDYQALKNQTIINLADLIILEEELSAWQQILDKTVRTSQHSDQCIEFILQQKLSLKQQQNIAKKQQYCLSQSKSVIFNCPMERCYGVHLHRQYNNAAVEFAMCNNSECITV
jgi:hypothetical protein